MGGPVYMYTYAYVRVYINPVPFLTFDCVWKLKKLTKTSVS